MKPLFAALAATAVALGAAPARAKDVVVRRAWDVERPLAEVVDAIAAYDAYCVRGCRYHVPSVVAAQILSYERRPDDFYVWTSVKDVKDSTWFSHVLVRREVHATHVDIRMVSPEKGAALEKATKHPHAPAVDASASDYQLQETAEAGKPPRTHVTLTMMVSLSGVSALFGSGIARDRMEEAAEEMRKNLSRAGAPPGK